MALTPPAESAVSGLCAVLELAAPDTPPVAAGAVVAGCTGVPALLWAPSPTRVAGVVGLTGVVGCCCVVCAAKPATDNTSPRPKTKNGILIAHLQLKKMVLNQRGSEHTNPLLL